MEKKICELKLNEIEAVVGGLTFNATASAYNMPKASSASVSTNPVVASPVIRTFV